MITPHLVRGTRSGFLVAAVVACTLALGGCVLTRQTTPIQVYDPVVIVQAQPDWPQVDWQLLVIRPIADQMYDSQRILVRPEPARLQVYRGASWSASLPDLLHSIILRGFEDSGKIGAVTRQSTSMRARFALTLDVRSFEAVYDDTGPPTAVIRVHAKLIHGPTTRVIDARTFSHEARSEATDTASVVAAFQQALEEFTHELVGWTLIEGEGAGPRIAQWRETRAEEREEEQRGRRDR